MYIKDQEDNSIAFDLALHSIVSVAYFDYLSSNVGLILIGIVNYKSIDSGATTVLNFFFGIELTITVLTFFLLRRFLVFSRILLNHGDGLVELGEIREFTFLVGPFG